MFDAVRRSFPAKLLLATALVLAVAGGYAAVTAAETTEEVRQEAVTDLTTDAEQASATTAVWLDRVESQSRTAAALVAAERPRAALEEFTATHDLPAGVVGVGYRVDGRYLAATADAMAGTDPATQGAPWIGTGQDQQFSAPYNVSWYDRPVVAMTLPAGEGQVVTLLDLHEFSESIGPNHERVVIADADRQIVGSHDVGTIGSTHRAVGGTIPSLADGGEATASVMDDRGTVMAFAPVEGAPWTLMIHDSTASAFSTAGAVESNLVAILFMGLVGLVVVGATVGSSSVISVRQLSRRAEQMADGDLEVPLETRRIDEFGDLYGSLATMRDDLRERIEDAKQAREEAEREREQAEEFNDQLRQTASEYAETMRAAAAGDLTRRLDTDDRSEVMADIGTEFNEMLAEIEETTGALVAFAEDVGDTAAAVDTRAGEVQEASEQVAASIEDIQTGAREQDDSLEAAVEEIEGLSASAEEIAATTDDVADTSQQAAEAAEAGADAAARALEGMDDVVTITAEAASAIEALDEEMAQIGEIVDVIGDIAEETNMLALNASIEAARADGGEDGTGGQGFAVVADEVKSLSEETKGSAEEIEERIRAVQQQTGDAVETVGQAKEAVEATADTVRESLTELDTIAERVESTDSSIQEISEVTSDQAGSAQVASDRIDEVAEISRQTVAEADEVAAAADQQTDAVEAVRAEVSDLRGQAQTLAQLLNQFTVGADRPDGPATEYQPASPDGGYPRQGGE
jgi:methyl-accepting chemotaxis protein